MAWNLMPNELITTTPKKKKKTMMKFKDFQKSEKAISIYIVNIIGNDVIMTAYWYP